MNKMNSQQIQPLGPGDLKLYDVRPDGQLTLLDFTRNNAFDEAKFHHFVERYIRTADIARRSDFRHKMSLGLWEKVRSRIDAIAAERSAISTVMQDRIAYIQQNEFEHDVHFHSTRGQYGLINETTERSDAGSYYRESRVQHDVVFRQAYFTRVHLSPVWRFNLALSSRAERKVGSLTLINDFDKTQSEFASWLLRPQISSSVKSADDRYAVRAEAEWREAIDPGEDAIFRKIDANASLDFKKVPFFGNPLSAATKVTWEQERRTKPSAASPYLQRSKDQMGVQAVLSYHLGADGIYAKYDYVDTEATGRTTVSDTRQHDASLLYQRTMGEHYLRAGVDSRVTDGNSDDRLRDYQFTTDTGRAGLHVSGKVQLATGLTLDATGKANWEVADGTFRGGYPSWSTQLKLSYDAGNVAASIQGSYAGHRIDLNESQASDAFKLDANLKVRFTDWMSGSVALERKFENTRSFDAAQDRNTRLHLNLNAEMPFYRKLSVWTYFGIYESAHAFDDGPRTDYVGYWAGVGARVGY